MVKDKDIPSDAAVENTSTTRSNRELVPDLTKDEYRLAIETSGFGFWILEKSGKLLDVNEAYARMSGYSRSELLGMHFTNLVAHDCELITSRIFQIVRRDNRVQKARHRRKDGTLWDVEYSASYSKKSGGHFFVIFHEIIDHTSPHQQLIHLSSEIFENSNEAIVITDVNGTILNVNAAYCRITGYGREEIIGEKPSKLKSGKHDAEFYAQMWQSLRDKGVWAGEIWDRRKNGEIFPKWLSIKTIYDDVGQATQYLGSFSDISMLKGIESELQKLAYYDPLTGLPNRALFRDRLTEELNRCQRYDGYCAVLFLDLDRFKLINDTMGHAAGDEVLVEVAQRIQKSLRSTDTFARMGGDEFTLLLPNISSTDAVAYVAKNIIELLNAPLIVHGEEVRLGGSIGIAVYPSDGDNLETLTRHADTAMYEAKARGRGQYHFFSAYMDQIAHEHLRLESDLHHALERNEFHLNFQPQIDARNDQVVRSEALIRWVHPERGIVSPDKFIPIAEESGLILQIGDYVIREVCRLIKMWREQGIEVPPIAINLSARQFRQADLVKRIMDILKEYEVGVEALEFEITEGVAMENAESTMYRLSMLANEGFSIAIDDFGTGYSSLSYLKTFPLNKLKLDRSFVMDIPGDQNDAAISSAVIRMAHSLGMEVIAEGVETIEQVAFLLEEGCTIMQGYHFSKPLSADDYIQFLQRS